MKNKLLRGVLWTLWLLAHIAAVWWMCGAIAGGLEIAHIEALSVPKLSEEDAQFAILKAGATVMVLPLLSALVLWRINLSVLREAGVLGTKEIARPMVGICTLILCGAVIWHSVRGWQKYQNHEFRFQIMADKRQKALPAAPKSPDK